MKIELKKLSDLKPAPYNPRQSNAEQEKQLKSSLEKFGVVEPIIFNKQTGFIVGGHFRIRELKKLGYKEIECVIVDLNEADEKELNIRLNANTGSWDWDELANNWDSELLSDWGLEIPGFEPTILEAEEDDFNVTEGGIETDIVLGDLFEIGEHRLLCGDSTDSDQVAKLMNGEKADMVFTDPPYGVDYQGGALSKRTKLDNDQKNTNIYSEVLPNIILFTVDKAPMYIWHAAGYADMAAHLWDNDLEIRTQIIWNKNMAQFGALSAQYKQKHEPCFYCFKKGNAPYWYGPTNEVTVWDVSRESKNEFHPTQKPIELPSRALNNSSKKGDYILDLFLGSGSTMVASHQLKRKCYGMELDPKYCQVIIDRMKKLDPSIKIKRNGIELK
jgi:DNA modification methylase